MKGGLKKGSSTFLVTVETVEHGKCTFAPLEAYWLPKNLAVKTNCSKLLLAMIALNKLPRPVFATNEVGYKRYRSEPIKVYGGRTDVNALVEPVVDPYEYYTLVFQCVDFHLYVGKKRRGRLKEPHVHFVTAEDLV